MATVTASSVSSSDSVERFRQEFNTLRSDVSNIQSGNLTINNEANNRILTSVSTNTFNAEESLTFDGSTFAVSGAVTVSGLTTLSGNLVIPNDGVIGSAGDNDAIEISSAGNVTFSDGIRVGDGSGDLNSYLAQGNLILGQTSDGTEQDQNSHGIFIYDDASDGTTFTSLVVYNDEAGSPVFQHKVNNDLRSEIESNGDFLSKTNSYGAVSDVNLKENISDSGSQWDDIKSLRIRKFSWKDQKLSSANMLGVIAQEVESAGMKGLVATNYVTKPSPNGDEVPELDSDGNQKTFKSVRYSILYTKAIKALQEAMTRIETLEEQCSSIEEQTNKTDSGLDELKKELDSTNTKIDKTNIIVDDIQKKTVKRNVIEIRDSDDNVLNSITGFEPGAI